jgi:hypothetical protein
MQTLSPQKPHLLTRRAPIPNITKRIARHTLRDPDPEIPLVSRQPPLLRRVPIRNPQPRIRSLVARPTRTRRARIRHRQARVDAILRRRPAAHVRARVRVAACGTLGWWRREAAVELADAQDVFWGELLGVVVGVWAACEREGAGQGEGVVAVEHDAVEVEGAAVGENGVGAVVVAEGDGELTGPASAAVGGRGAAVIGVGVSGGGGAEGVVDEVGADEGVVDVGVGALLFVDEAEEVACVTVVSLYRGRCYTGLHLPHS